MRERIVIVGAGGFGREVLEMLDSSRFDVQGFIDPCPPTDFELPVPVLGDDAMIPELKRSRIADSVCIAIGNASQRERLFELADGNGLQTPTIVHDSSVISGSSSLGTGTVVFPNVVVTSNCKIGRGVLLNSGATLGHDTVVGDFSNVGPGVNLAGRMNIGRLVVIGIGVCSREMVRIGDRAVVGAGSVLIRDISSDALAYGVPAREQVRPYADK